MKKLILIDGNAILHRAYHALPPLTTPDGKPIQAVFGFFSMLLTILNDQKPEYLMVCFDRPKPTFRQQLYAGYHEHRPKIADEFVSQIVKVHEIVAKMDIPLFELDGYEADDLIGTISHELVKKHKDVQVLIVSGDRDLLQLVNKQVMVLSPLVGLKTLTIYDEQKVEEKFGVHPSQFIDYKALIGDASDGYPGVAGIGPKTAADLIRKFETFENLYQNLGDVNPKIAEKLATDAEQAALAKKLATIMTDVPIHPDIDKAAITNVHIKNARKIFEELGFNSLLKRLDMLDGAVESAVASSSAKAMADKKAKADKGKKDDAEQLGLL
jgi:DNA polymerase-1